MISNDEIKEIIADMQNKIGDLHAVIHSKQAMVDICKELLQYRSIIDMGPSVENADNKKYLPTNQMGE